MTAMLAVSTTAKKKSKKVDGSDRCFYSLVWMAAGSNADSELCTMVITAPPSVHLLGANIRCGVSALQKYSARYVDELNRVQHTKGYLISDKGVHFVGRVNQIKCQHFK